MTDFGKIIFLTLISGVLITIIPTNAKLTEDPPTCIGDEIELWPHLNPNYYWFCETKGSTPKKMKCPEGRGFLRIATEVSGCIPWESWKCTSKFGPPLCNDNESRSKPHRHVNPNKFWACTEETPSKAVEADCLDFPHDPTENKHTRGFVSNKNNLGCVPWDYWVCDKAGDDTRV